MVAMNCVCTLAAMEEPWGDGVVTRCTANDAVALDAAIAAPCCHVSQSMWKSVKGND